MKKIFYKFIGKRNVPTYLRISDVKKLEPIPKGTKVIRKNNEVCEFKDDYNMVIETLREGGYRRF